MPTRSTLLPDPPRFFHCSCQKQSGVRFALQHSAHSAWSAWCFAWKRVGMLSRGMFFWGQWCLIFCHDQCRPRTSRHSRQWTNSSSVAEIVFNVSHCKSKRSFLPIFWCLKLQTAPVGCTCAPCSDWQWPQTLYRLGVEKSVCYQEAESDVFMTWKKSSHQACVGHITETYKKWKTSGCGNGFDSQVEWPYSNVPSTCTCPTGRS